MKRKNRKLTIGDRLKSAIVKKVDSVFDRAFAWMPPSKNYKNDEYRVWHFLRRACMSIAYVWLSFIVPVLKAIGIILFMFCVDAGGRAATAWLSRNI